MTSARTFFAALTALLVLSACGFKPMYAEHTGGEGLNGEFSNVAIAPIEDRIGQVVRNHLLDRINPYGEPSAPDYFFRVSLDKTLEGYGFRSDESVTRESLTLTASYQLVEQKSGKVVLEDEVRAIQAYDIVQSDFANFSAEQDAEERTAERIAEMLTARLGLYFKSEN
jgi:LPS-assembly lipoprotein